MSTQTISLPANADQPLTVTDIGQGRPVLLLHGGGGPRTTASFAELLSATPGAELRVISPIHPGFDGTPRAESVTSPADVARLYVELLEALELRDVLVVGNSLGGWIAAELAILDPAVASGYLLVDAVGIEVADHPGVDFFSLAPAEIADYSFYTPDAFRIDPSVLPPEALAMMAANMTTLRVYGGEAMADATLRARLGAVRTPTLVVWGEADRIKDPEYGRALAAAIPGARYELLPRTGHLPQMETPETLRDVVNAFVATLPTSAAI